MGKRGGGSFRRSDASRAIAAAREGGLEPGVIEITIEKSGAAIIRVYGRGTIATPNPPAPAEGDPEVMSIQEWEAEGKKLKDK